MFIPSLLEMDMADATLVEVEVGGSSRSARQRVAFLVAHGQRSERLRGAGPDRE
jgi:hypothetical protein